MSAALVNTREIERPIAPGIPHEERVRQNIARIMMRSMCMVIFLAIIFILACPLNDKPGRC
jgi:hypothetical protein